MCNDNKNNRNNESVKETKPEPPTPPKTRLLYETQNPNKGNDDE